MKMKIQKTKPEGVGFTGLLTLLFITLKLCGVVSWSWWWVLSPIWISFLLVAAILGFFGLMALIARFLRK